ncbi:MAG: type IIA DNA topoisomerase subunit B [Deltaproteobacteria bacterium]|nr:type IIA DNA topoisomerase subunit B [Deltaproteobacteria bacterium]
MSVATYTAKDITVLEGLEPIRKRPAMFIGSTDARGFHHLLWELVDNSVDEIQNGHGSSIDVTLHADGRSATVEDDGRGIPVDMHAKYKRPALELILTTMHAGGKFDRTNYKRSGGLHGVGSSVVCALADEMMVKVTRDGGSWEQSFSRGKPTSKLRGLGKARGHGTRITYRADEDVFGAARWDGDLVRTRIEAKAYLVPGLKITVRDETSGRVDTFVHEGGLSEYLEKILSAAGKRPSVPATFTLHKDNGIRLDLALAWTDSTEESVRSYANGVQTPSGGSHENGLRSGIVKAVRNLIGARPELCPRGVNLAAEDIREGMAVVLSVYVEEPQFEGQTKDRLNNPEVLGFVDAGVRGALENWLLENPSVAETLVARMSLAARAREAARTAASEVQRKSAVSHRLNLPGKLADCSSTDPSHCELFIVEGDSAGGSAKQGRDRRTQAILPLKGKVLNTEQASSSKVLANKELQDLVSALGCGVGKDFDVAKLRYGRVIILTDADSDGHHIATLLLTFFCRHLPGLIRAGHVFLAQPPLYRIDAGSDTHWAKDDSERDRVLRMIGGRAKPEISRFKGLGEMMPNVLRDTTLDPRQRRLLRIIIDDEIRTDQILTELMGKDVQARYRFIVERAREVEEIDV